MLEIWGSEMVLNRLVAPTFQVFLVAQQLRGQQAPERTQTAQCRHHGVFVIHVGILVALPAAQTAAEAIKASQFILVNANKIFIVVIFII